MLFSIKSNILLSSILGFVLVSNASLQNGYIRKWDTQKIGNKKRNEREKGFLRMWSSAKWHHLKRNENEIRWSKKDAITIPRNKSIIQYIFWKPISPHTESYKIVFYTVLLFNTFYKQFCILHEFFVAFFTSSALLI